MPESERIGLIRSAAGLHHNIFPDNILIDVLIGAMGPDTTLEHRCLAPFRQAGNPQRRNIDINNIDFKCQISGGSFFIGYINLNLISTDIAGHGYAAESFGLFIKVQPFRQRAVINQPGFKGGFSGRFQPSHRAEVSAN